VCYSSYQGAWRGDTRCAKGEELPDSMVHGSTSTQGRVVAAGRRPIYHVKRRERATKLVGCEAISKNKQRAKQGEFAICAVSPWDFRGGVCVLFLFASQPTSECLVHGLARGTEIVATLVSPNQRTPPFAHETFSFCITNSRAATSRCKAPGRRITPYSAVPFARQPQGRRYGAGSAGSALVIVRA
jgi:hypothetical protein